MADTYFVGLRGTADVVDNEREGAWRQGILRIFPNGMAPLTALTALMKKEKTSDPHFHWWTKTLTTQRAAVTGVYNDAALSSSYTSGGVSGSVVYAKIAAADTLMFRAGHQVLLRDASDPTMTVVGKVLSVTVNGASSALCVRLIEADDNSTAGNLSNCDTVLIVGNINPQGGLRPVAISQSPTEHSNYTQIFRDPLQLTRTAMQTSFRTGDKYTEGKRDTLEQHSIGMEKGFLWGVATSGWGDNGQPETTTSGLITQVKAEGTVEDYSLDTDFSGKKWIEGGMDWLEAQIELMFRYGGGTERLCFCGSGALQGVQKLVRELGFYTISTGQEAFGIKVTRLETVHGTLVLKTHPLFSYEPVDRYSMLCFEPANVTYRFIQDTIFKPDNTQNQGGGDGFDGKAEEFLTEAGLELHHPETCAYLTGVGVDNAV